MWKIFGIRITSNVLYGAGLFISALVTIRIIFFTIGDDHPATQSSWRTRWAEPDPETTYLTSPYNANNKIKRVAEKPPPGTKPKLISWQASGTLMVTSASSDMFKECPGVRTCKLTPSKTVIGQAAAVVYDGRKMAKQTPPMLTDDRILIYYSMRTPKDEFAQAKGELYHQYWKGAFNWVWSYRLDSDIFEPFAYIKKVGAPEDDIDALIAKKSKTVLFINPQINRRSDGVEQVDKNLHKGRSITGVEAYMKAFEKHLPYDTINMTDLIDLLKPGPDGTEGNFKISKYFFILAFESVDCPDYVTDLFFNAFDPRIIAVPVVRGGFNYTRHAPKFTYIDANAYETPRQLAAHLQKVASNPKAYKNLLFRKMQYKREDGLPNAWCQLCNMLYQAETDKSLTERIDDINGWYNEGGGCLLGDEEEEEEGEGDEDYEADDQGGEA